MTASRRSAFACLRTLASPLLLLRLVEVSRYLLFPLHHLHAASNRLHAFDVQACWTASTGPYGFKEPPLTAVLKQLGPEAQAPARHLKSSTRFVGCFFLARIRIQDPPSSASGGVFFLELVRIGSAASGRGS